MPQEFTKPIIEQELTKLQTDLQHNLQMVSKLAQVQNDFADLSQTYQNSRRFLNATQTTFAEIQQKSQHTLDHLQHQGQQVQQAIQSLDTLKETTLNGLRTAFQQERNSLQVLQGQVQQSHAALQQLQGEVAQSLQALTNTNERQWQALEARAAQAKNDAWLAAESIHSDLNERINKIQQQTSHMVGRIDTLESQISIAQVVAEQTQVLQQETKKIQTELHNLRHQYKRDLRWANISTTIALLVTVGLVGYLFGPSLLPFLLQLTP
jgi:chromosome segregation ATPase